MDSTSLHIKRVVLFRRQLVDSGGAERLMLEQVKYLEKNNIKTYIVTFAFDSKSTFYDTYKIRPIIPHKITSSNNSFVKMIDFIQCILSLRKAIIRINPDIIFSQTSSECIYLFFSTLMTPFIYVSYMHETVAWFDKQLRKYALIYRKALKQVKESTTGHRAFIAQTPPKSNILDRIQAEAFALLEYIAVRRARRLFVLSNQMKWEADKLYGKEATVAKGAFPHQIFDYKRKQDVKQKLGLADKKMVLNVNSLTSKKRVDLVITAFQQIFQKFGDVALIIGGLGSEEENLKNLVKRLDIEGKVKFMGFIPEEELWDYYAACDVFVHPNWADFAIAPYEALAFQKNVVWTKEMETDEHLSGNKHIFVAEPTSSGLTEAIEKALNTKVTEDFDMSQYTWDNYFDKIMSGLIGIDF